MSTTLSARRKVEISPPLFPGYCFIVAVPQWHVANRSPGVRRLFMDGERPANVADSLVEGIRARERGGLVELPKPPRFRRGEAVRILQGPFVRHVGLYEGMRPRETVEVLLAFLGSHQRVTLPADGSRAGGAMMRLPAEVYAFLPGRHRPATAAVTACIHRACRRTAAGVL